MSIVDIGQRCRIVTNQYILAMKQFFLLIFSLLLSGQVCASQTQIPAQPDLAERKSNALREVIASKYKIISEDNWYGFNRIKFQFHNWTAWIVEPNVDPAEGRPWTWTMQWAESFVDRTGVLDLLSMGYHHVTVEAFDKRADDQSLDLFAEYQNFLVNDLHLAPKANLVGMSWGGFFSIRYATKYPSNINRIYLDAPLLVFKDFAQSTLDAIGPWADSIPENWLIDSRMPVNMAEELAKYNIPILLLYGGQDQTVPPTINSEFFASRYKAAGGTIYVKKRGGYGHHPHGEDPDKTLTITNFFLGK